MSVQSTWRVSGRWTRVSDGTQTSWQQESSGGFQKKALRELSGSNKPQHKTKVSTVKCSYVEREHAGQSSEDSWVHLDFFSLPWLPHAEGQQTKTEKTWLAKAKLLPACHVGSLGWKENKQTIKQSWVFPQFEIEKYRSWKIHHEF